MSPLPRKSGQSRRYELVKTRAADRINSVSACPKARAMHTFAVLAIFSQMCCGSNVQYVASCHPEDLCQSSSLCSGNIYRCRLFCFVGRGRGDCHSTALFTLLNWKIVLFTGTISWSRLEFCWSRFIMPASQRYGPLLQPPTPALSSPPSHRQHDFSKEVLYTVVRRAWVKTNERAGGTVF